MGSEKYVLDSLYIFHQPILFHVEVSVAMCFMLQFTYTVMDNALKEPLR